MKNTLVTNKNLNIQAYIYFTRFLYDPNFTLDNLIIGLNDIETTLKNGRLTQKGLWFRFFNGDTLVTTIFNLEHDLKPHNTNNQFTIAQIGEALNHQSLAMHYS